jgi:hypothetical protein
VLCGGVVFGSGGNAAVQGLVLHTESGCSCRKPTRFSENKHSYVIQNQGRAVAEIVVT